MPARGRRARGRRLLDRRPARRPTAPRVDLSALRRQGRAALADRARLPARACIAHPRITLHGPAPAPLPKAEPPKYVILWVMDALRADKIPIVHARRARADAELRRAREVVDGVPPVLRSGQRVADQPLEHVDLAVSGGAQRAARRRSAAPGASTASSTSSATQLADAGFHTIGVTGNGFVNEDGGYARGFDEFRNMMRENGVDNNVIFGEKIVDAALDKLDKHRDGPTFLFLGTIDTHGPWIARKPWIDITCRARTTARSRSSAPRRISASAGSMGCSIIPPPADIERLRAIYDCAVSYHDQQLGRLVAKLKSWGIWDQTMLIVTADHGEELFEDGRCGHGGSLRDTLVHVPLLVHYPPLFPAGTISTRAPRASISCRRSSTRSACRRSTPAGRAARAARARRRRGLGAAVVRVAVRVRARDAARPLEGEHRQVGVPIPLRCRRRSGRDERLAAAHRSSAGC